ncbi:MAG: hypothetical protein LH479_06780 [Polaromonas sp.]|nr:hypothetical protein [Polaromonas sp.]
MALNIAGATFNLHATTMSVPLVLIHGNIAAVRRKTYTSGYPKFPGQL